VGTPFPSRPPDGAHPRLAERVSTLPLYRIGGRVLLAALGRAAPNLVTNAY